MNATESLMDDLGFSLFAASMLWGLILGALLLFFRAGR